MSLCSVCNWHYLRHKSLAPLGDVRCERPLRAGVDDDRPLAIGQGEHSFSVVGHADGAPSVAAGAVLFEAKLVSGTGSTLPANEPSTATGSNRTGESTSTTKSGFDGVKRSNSRKKVGVDRASKTIKILEKTGH